MNYSKKWLDKIDAHSDYPQNKTWEEIIDYYNFRDETVAKNHNLVTLTEGVWMEISECYNDNMFYFIKVRAISYGDTFFDGSDEDGCIAMGAINHIYRIDGHELNLKDAPKYSQDLYKAKNPEYQNKLLAFIRKYAGISDKNLPQIPDGIIKLPDSML